MTIQQNRNGTELTVALTGRLDTTTAPQLEAELVAAIPDITNLIFDFTGLDYVSSAGLRVLLSAQKKMNKQGSMVLHNVGESIMEVLEITGFLEILTVV